MGPFLIQPADIPPPTRPHTSLVPSAFLTSPFPLPSCLILAGYSQWPSGEMPPHPVSPNLIAAASSHSLQNGLDGEA